MKRSRCYFGLVSLLLTLAGGALPMALAQTKDKAKAPEPRAAAGPRASVLTQHNDNMRTGAYLVEKQLTPATVDPNTGTGVDLRYWRPVNGALLAQLLYAQGVQVGPAKRDMVYAFTNTNMLYAYDANEERAPGTELGPIWRQHLPVTPHATLHKPWGAVGTPVIDQSRHTLFVVYGISNGLLAPGDGVFKAEFYLAALDIRTGKLLRDPVVVSGSVPSRVPPGRVDFVASRQTQKAGLLLAPNPVEPGRRTVYVAFGARWPEETHNYHGWVMGYDAETLELRWVFCATPDRRKISEGGGIWQGGAGLAADKAGNVYFNTGNGPALGNDHGNSIVKLTPVRRTSGAYDFRVAAFSAAADDPAHAYEWEATDDMPYPGAPGVMETVGNDIDLGAGGVTVIPGLPQLVGGGKTGVLYLMDRRTMAKLQSFEAFDNTYDSCRKPASDRPAPNTCSRYGGNPRRDDSWASGPHLHGAPTYWNISPDRGLVFYWSEKDHLKQFEHDKGGSGLLKPKSALLGDVRAEGRANPAVLDSWVMPGGLISLSANGTHDGLLWITLPWPGGGRVFAYDALSLRRLWDTTLPFHLSHHNPPTVADGRVFVGTGNGRFLVYGSARPVAHLLPDVPRTPETPPLIPPQPWIREFLGRLSPQAAAAIAPPQNHRPLSLARGSGVLTYEAQRGRDGAAVEWLLVGVRGDLRDESGVTPHRGYGGLGAVLATADQGLTWTVPDGPQMRWSVATSVHAPETGNAPWVLFRSVALGAPEHPTHDGGLLGAVTYVQQLATEGGAPPDTTAPLGHRVDVPYTALYAFYVEAGTQPIKDEGQ